MIRTTTMFTTTLAVLCGVALAEDNAVIKGTVKWSAKPVNRKAMKIEADPYCQQMYSGKELLSEKLVVNENSTLKDVFVYVKSGLPEREWPMPTEPVLLDQKGCHYEPHVFGVRAGQEILVRNSDDTAHNIHAVPKNNTEFNKGQPKKGMEFKEKFDNAEIGLKVKCDVHPWMSAYVNVMTHPFFAVSDENGAFEISGLPAGEYVVSTWCEDKRLKPKETTITVGAGETKEIEIAYPK